MRAPACGPVVRQPQLHALAINPVVYAELSMSFTTLEALDRVVDGMGLVLRKLPRPALFLAAKAFAQCRQRGGSKTRVLPDLSSAPMRRSKADRC